MLRFVTPTSLIRVAVEVPADVVANNETLPLDLIFHVPMPIVGGALLTEASQAAQPPAPSRGLPLAHPRLWPPPPPVPPARRSTSRSTGSSTRIPGRFSSSTTTAAGR